MKRVYPERKRAIVIGGSMAGLLAARVLSDFYEQVTIVERDSLSSENEHRRGVPHGRHAHALLAGGQQVLELLFPGIGDELVAAGAVPADPANDGTWFFEGAPLRKTPSGTTGVLTSRPFLESAVRAKVRTIDHVEILGNTSVRGLAWNQANSRVAGVFTEEGGMDADIVVDASGRGSRAAAWLSSAGFRPAREEKVEVQLAYTTRSFRARCDRLPDDKFVVLAPTPEGKRGGVIGIQENETWIVTLFGHFGHEAPSDLSGFIEFARTLPSKMIHDAIRDAEPISEPVTFRFPASTRRHYEELSRFPEGFLAFGDAICSFNPIYGQGMSVAAMQARALQQQLVKGHHGLAKRFYKAAGKVIDTPWSIAVGSDLRLPELKEKRTLAANILNWYFAKVHKFAHSDAHTSRAFLRVAQLLDDPASLMRPKFALRVLTGGLRRPRVSASTTAAARNEKAGILSAQVSRGD